MKKLFSNKRLVISVIAITLVVIFAVYQWGTAMFWHKEILELCNFEKSCDTVGDLSAMYNFPIKKIVLFSGIIFSSAFLLLSALRHKE